MNSNRYCVIMAGGIGTRFWPMSRQSCPKQFLDILGTGKSFIRHTYERFNNIVPKENFIVVTNRRYKELVLEHIPELEESQILCEPIGRNTAPCIAYAAYTLKQNNPDATMIVSPSDHLILNENEFLSIVGKALDFIAALPIESFWGVGRVTATKMRSLGIYNGHTLRQWSLDGLRKTFGKMGEVYYNFARGIDLRPVEPTYIRKSVGCEFTFEKDINTQAAVLIELYHVAEELIRRLKKEKFRGYTLTLKVKFHDFSQITRSATRTDVFVSMKTILPESKRLIKEVDYTDKPIRLLGLTVSNTHSEPSSDANNKGKADCEQLCLEF